MELDKTSPWKVILMLLWSLTKPHLGKWSWCWDRAWPAHTLESDPDVVMELDKTSPWKVILMLLWSLTKPHLGKWSWCWDRAWPAHTLDSDPDVGEGAWQNLTLESDPDVGIELDKTLPWKVILMLLWSLTSPYLGKWSWCWDRAWRAQWKRPPPS